MRKTEDRREQEVAEECNDEELIAEVQNGEVNSLKELYERYHGSVYGLSMGILGSHHDAEEVVQETFLQVWRKSLSYNPERGAISTWIMTIGRSRALDLIRKRSRMERKARESAMTRPSDSPKLSPEDNVMVSEEVEWLREAMDDLGSSLREVIALAYFRGLSHSEISSESQMSLGTVKWRLRAGTEKLGSIIRRRNKQRSRQMGMRVRATTSEIRAAG